MIDPRVRIVRLHLALEIHIHVFIQRHILCITLGCVRLHLSFFQDGLSVFIGQWTFDSYFVIPQAHGRHYSCLNYQLMSTINNSFKSVVSICAVGFYYQIPCFFSNIHPFIADWFPSLNKALAGINQLNSPQVTNWLVLGHNPHIGGNSGVIETIIG